MKQCERDSLIILTKQLLKEYTKLLDSNCTNIDGELRIKLGAEDYILKLPDNYVARIIEKDVEETDLENKHWEIYVGV